MAEQANAQLAKAAVVSPPVENLCLQRRCECGNHTVGGAECEQCASKKSPFNSSNRYQWSSPNPDAPEVVPQSDGQPLDLPLRHFMETRFQHDFSRVRLHTDAQADASAKSIGALAYTYGQDIFFDSAGFRPNTPHGITLIAHELSHVVQQSRHPLPVNEALRVEPERSSAEVEADRTALAVMTPGPVPEMPSARSRGLNRGAGWAVLGGLIGAVVGLLGLLAGPIGLIAVAAGAALGAWAGYSLSNDQSQNKRGTAGQRIHRLLTRTATDWVITDEEAQAALKILQDLEKSDPEELLNLAMLMKLSGKWETLKEELPSKDLPAFYYFDMKPLNPNHGFVMEGDTIHLEFYFPGQGFRSREKRDEARQAEIDRERDRYKTKDKDKDKDKKEIAPLTYEERISMDYEVESTGIRIWKMDKPIPVAGKTLEEAAELAARAFTDPLWTYEMAVDLTPVKRGRHYSGNSDVTSPETVTANSTTKDTEALARRDKRRKFVDHVPLSLVEVGGQTEMAVNLYYREVDKNLDKYDDPEALWKWAQAEAEKTYEELNKKTPRQEFELFAHRMLANVSTKPKDEQMRLYETWRRYSSWLDKQSDEKLTRKSPPEIWAQAYVNIIAEEIHKSSLQAMEELREKRRQEAFKQAEVKLQASIDFSIDRIWPSQRTRAVSAGEQISERTGEAVEVTYLIQASPAEKLMRDKIASDFLHDQIQRMMKDPEEFNKRSVRDDFILYLDKNPEQLKALHLTVAHPDVERQEHRIDIPAWQTATEIIVGFIPFVGQAVAIGELVTGRDLFGHPLTTTERVILGVAIVLPGIAKVVKGGKAAFTASRIVKEYGLHGDEAARVYKIYMGLAPGTPAAKLFDWGAKQIKKGRAVDDPKVLQEMEVILKDLGMTDKETAKALMPVAMKEQIETVAKEEVQALKAMAGPMTTETEEMLMKNAALREALKENSLAARVLKKCNTPCWPEEATAEQVQRLEHLIERLKKADAFDEEFLRRFLYRRRKNLDKAIDAIADKTVAAETAQVAKQAKAAAKQAKAEAKIMDVAERNKAAADLERAEAKIAERKADITAASQEGRQLRKDLAALLAQGKPVPSSLRSEITRIEKLKSLEQRLDALEKLKPASQAEREFLDWRRKTWELQQEAEASEEAAKFLGEGFETLVTQKEVAAQALRESSQDVMAVLRTEGPNYRGKSSINLDQVMTKASWDALTTKPALATDHLVALDRISKLSQLNELLVLYTKASKPVKAEIKQALKGLGDMDKNLVRMRSDVNSGLKSNKSWHDITYAQVEGKYTVGEVDAIRTREDEALSEILAKIDELTNTFRAKVTTKPATKAAAAGAK
jgi:hypothetical protein